VPDQLGTPLATPLFDHIALVGLGLIGSSLARGIRRKNIAATITAIDRDPAVIERVKELGLADVSTTDAVAGIEKADLVILCVPVGACSVVAELIGPHLAQGAILSDVGSVKAAVVQAVSPHLPGHSHRPPGQCATTR
jgi:cyclohexadieny/prephenate dehydrogenase